MRKIIQQYFVWKDKTTTKIFIKQKSVIFLKHDIKPSIQN